MQIKGPPKGGPFSLLSILVRSELTAGLTTSGFFKLFIELAPCLFETAFALFEPGINIRLRQFSTALRLTLDRRRGRAILLCHGRKRAVRYSVILHGLQRCRSLIKLLILLLNLALCLFEAPLRLFKNGIDIGAGRLTWQRSTLLQRIERGVAQGIGFILFIHDQA